MSVFPSSTFYAAIFLWNECFFLRNGLKMRKLTLNYYTFTRFLRVKLRGVF